MLPGITSSRTGSADARGYLHNHPSEIACVNYWQCECCLKSPDHALDHQMLPKITSPEHYRELTRSLSESRRRTGITRSRTRISRSRTGISRSSQSCTGITLILSSSYLLLSQEQQSLQITQATTGDLQSVGT